MYKVLPIALALLLPACASMDEDPTAEWTAEEFYEEAKNSIDAGEFQTAIKNLETLEARFPFDPYAKQAQLDIAYAYYKFEEPESTISAIDRFMRLHPRDPSLDYAYYLKGLAHFTRGSSFLDGWVERDHSRHDSEVLHNAYNNFSTLVRRYPNSHYAGDAYQRMIFLRNKMAKKEITIAEFYLERKTWLSAANRAKVVIENYQDSVWSYRALEILVESYNNLGLETLAADAQRVLDLNVPVLKQAPVSDDEIELPPTVTASGV